MNNVLTRNSLSRAVNIFARLFQIFNKHLNFYDCQQKAQKRIVCVYQHEEENYIKSFGGNIFSKIAQNAEDEPTMLQVRENKMGKEFLYLIPKKTLLFKKILEYFHEVTGHGSDMYVRMWATREGFYIPNALPALAKYRRSCITCRKKAEIHVGSEARTCGGQTASHWLYGNSMQ